MSSWPRNAASWSAALPWYVSHVLALISGHKEESRIFRTIAPFPTKKEKEINGLDKCFEKHIEDLQ
jgi:hypothetical protein